MGRRIGIDWRHCPDCAVSTNEEHMQGCDVARCKDCGRQELTCEHQAPMTAWKGYWPGDKEVDEGLAHDLNDLNFKGLAGRLVWDQVHERWSKRPVEAS